MPPRVQRAPHASQPFQMSGTGACGTSSHVRQMTWSRPSVPGAGQEIGPSLHIVELLINLARLRSSAAIAVGSVAGRYTKWHRSAGRSPRAIQPASSCQQTLTATAAPDEVQWTSGPRVRRPRAIASGRRWRCGAQSRAGCGRQRPAHDQRSGHHHAFGASSPNFGASLAN
jgi:hypothetical protein